MEKLAWSLLAVAATLLAVKIINYGLSRLIEKKQQEEEPDSPVSRDLIISLGTLIKTVVFYSGAFAAVLIVLKIFNISLITAADAKIMGIMALKVIGIVVAARLAIKLGRATVTQIFNKKLMKGGLIDDRRASTLASLLKNLITYGVFFLAGLMILQAFGVNTSAILASAGILGLAVGFGAQSLVRDIISGFFILFEDQFAVGDYVEIGGIEGVVEENGLRICKIRSWTGQLHIIPNGEIKKVTNFNRGHMMAVVTVGIAYEEDVDRTLEVLKKECEAAKGDIPALLEVPVVQGVTALADFSVNIRTVARTVPGEQWATQRELLRRFKNVLDREGIEIPYPRRVITYREEYTGEDAPQAAKPQE
ncbi:MAG TPA: mechanosensitive ion channel family protein [Desulfotomaculum sp.]|nr:mechanosensitive ion channel family protein [Desulfotomaculum sp.]